MDNRRNVASEEAFILRLLRKEDLEWEGEMGGYDYVLLLRHCKGEAEEVYRRISKDGLHKIVGHKS